jgi:hypothetical protein
MLFWGAMCLAVWPPYYAGLLLEWLVKPVADNVLRSRWLDYNVDLYERFRRPPFVRQVRAAFRRRA